MKLLPSGVIVHSVLISFRQNVPDTQRENIISKYMILGDECGGQKEGILFWQVSKNMDQRKNWHLVELAVFRDRDALRHFQSHPAHARLGEIMSVCGDWVIGDVQIE